MTTSLQLTELVFPIPIDRMVLGYVPYSSNASLGSVPEWPQVPALLVLDSFAPQLRHQMLEKAACLRQETWTLRRHTSGPEDLNLAMLRRSAKLYAELPKKSMVLHREGCWESAAWPGDVESSRSSGDLICTWRHLSKTRPCIQQQFSNT